MLRILPGRHPGACLRPLLLVRCSMPFCFVLCHMQLVALAVVLVRAFKSQFAKGVTICTMCKRCLSKFLSWFRLFSLSSFRIPFSFSCSLASSCRPIASSARRIPYSHTLPWLGQCLVLLRRCTFFMYVMTSISVHAVISSVPVCLIPSTLHS